MNDPCDLRNWTLNDFERARREVRLAWFTEEAGLWPVLLQLFLQEMIEEKKKDQLDAEVSSEERRARFNQAKGARLTLERLMTLGFGLDERIRRWIEKINA